MRSQSWAEIIQGDLTWTGWLLVLSNIKTQWSLRFTKPLIRRHLFLRTLLQVLVTVSYSVKETISSKCVINVIKILLLTKHYRGTTVPKWEGPLYIFTHLHIYQVHAMPNFIFSYCHGTFVSYLDKSNHNFGVAAFKRLGDTKQWCQLQFQ